MAETNTTVLHKMSQIFDDADKGTQALVRWWEWFGSADGTFAVIGLLILASVCLWCCCPQCCWCCTLPCRLCRRRDADGSRALDDDPR